jgi:hypothetical protein
MEEGELVKERILRGEVIGAGDKQRKEGGEVIKGR